jgi:hypothetical protein
MDTDARPDGGNTGDTGDTDADREQAGTAPAGQPAAQPAAQPASGTVLVAFSNPDEFAEELNARGPNVEPVLRLTFRWAADRDGGPLTDLWVAASYLRRLDAGALAIVRLSHYVGAVWNERDDAPSRRVRERADQVRASIRRAAEAVGIEVRAGGHLPSAGEGQP